MYILDIGIKIVNSENRCLLLLQVIADSEDSGTSSVSTALVEACRNRDIGMADLLLRHSARDDDCKALQVAACNRDDILIAKLLSIKVTV
jgi:ankyrin repeat protein